MAWALHRRKCLKGPASAGGCERPVDTGGHVQVIGAQGAQPTRSGTCAMDFAVDVRSDIRIGHCWARRRRYRLIGVGSGFRWRRPLAVRCHCLHPCRHCPVHIVSYHPVTGRSGTTRMVAILCPAGSGSSEKDERKRSSSSISTKAPSSSLRDQLHRHRPAAEGLLQMVVTRACPRQRKNRPPSPDPRTRVSHLAFLGRRSCRNASHLAICRAAPRRAWCR